MEQRAHTVAAGLNRSLNVADALDGDTVLVIAVDEEIFQFANLVEQDAQLVGDIGNIFVAVFTPDGELLLPSTMN